MDRQEHIAVLKKLIQKTTENQITGAYSQIVEFLRLYAGPKNSFLQSIEGWNPRNFSASASATNIREILAAYLEFVEAGLVGGLSPERQAQVDVVSDFLDMANTLLTSRGVHPAAPAVLIGATLEEFLRNWVEAAGLSLGNRKPALEAYSQVLRESDLITKQDGKDITAWSGVRNHAAHGEWDQVGDTQRVALMLEGVNLFMRKYAT